MGTASPPGTRIDLDALALVLRSMFPHRYFPDGPYRRTAAAIAVSGEVDPGTAAQLEQGLAELGAAEFAALDGQARLEYLSEIAGGTFFEAIRARAILVLYNDPEVWELLGYEVPD
jgi:hypothetical protein